MKVKKGIISLVTAFSVITAGGIMAEGAEITGLTLNDGVVTVTGTSEAERIAIKVIPSDDAEETDIGKVIEMNEVVTVDGSFEYKFKMPDVWNGEPSDGTYKVIVTDSERDTYEYMYVSAVARQNLLDSLNNSENIGSVLMNEEYDNAFSNLGVDVEFYRNLDVKGRESFEKIFKNTAGTDEINGENLSDIYNIAVVVQSINNNDVTDEIVDSYGFVFGETEYKDIEDEDLKKWNKEILAANAPYEKTSEVEAVYEEANITFLLNTAKYTKYDELVDKYDYAINIKSESFYKKYLDLSGSKKTSVNSALKNELAKNPAESYEDFVEAYEDAYDEGTAEKKNSGGGGGGGSSSGGTKVSGTTGGLSISGVEDYPAAEKAPEFSDMSTAEWAREAVVALASRGIISGYEDGTFKPNKEVTREEFVKMIILAMNINGSNSNGKFRDVSAEAWYAPYVNAAVEKGIVNGVSETEFGIGSGIIRQDMAVIVKRAVGEVPSIRDYAVFGDESEISDYARSAVEALYKAGKISGMSSDVFAPKGAVTRAQAAKILYDTFVGGAK